MRILILFIPILLAFDINTNIKLSVFEPYYLRNDSLFSSLKDFKIKLFFMRILYHILNPVRKWKWLNMDKDRSDIRDEYFSKR